MHVNRWPITSNTIGQWFNLTENKIVVTMLLAANKEILFDKHTLNNNGNNPFIFCMNNVQWSSINSFV